MVNNFTEKANFIWSVADLIRDTFKRGRYQDVVLPFTVLRRIDQILESKLLNGDPAFAVVFQDLMFNRYLQMSQAHPEAQV